MRKRLSDKFRTALLYLRCSRAFPNRQISRGGAKNSSDSLSAPAPVHGAATGRTGGNRLSDGQRRAPVGSGAESRPASQRTDATNAQARRRKCAQAGFGPPKDVRPADDVRQRCVAAGRSAGSRGRQTAPHDRIRTGAHGGGGRMRGGELNRTVAPGRTPEAAAGKSAGSRGRQTAPHDRIRTGTHDAGHECGGGAEPHGGSRHRRRPARPHRAAHDDRRHYRPPRRHLTAAELPALCGDAGTMREKRGTCGRPPRTAEKRPDDRIRLLAMQF